LTYDAREKSEYSGEPVEVYKFDREGIRIWRYTSADRDVVLGGDIYLAAPIKRNDIEGSQDVERTALKITMPADADFPEQFIASPPTDRIMVEVRRYHYQDSEIAFLWVGRVVNVEHREFEAIILCESAISSLKRPTLRRVYQTSCPHLLYGQECGIAKATFGITAALSAGTSGVTLKSATFAGYTDAYFAGGFVEVTISGNVNRAFIVNHVGDTLTTGLPLQGAAVGLSVTAYPGCDHSLDTCVTKFSNNVNYGGFPYIPQKNPMGGTPIF
jgi:uncharacterized phage protein (TIGR02218 family)